MRRFAVSFVAIFMIGLIGLAQPPIRLPVFPVAPTPPSPTPVPQAISKLESGQLYVVDSDVDCIVLASPEGIVKMTEGKGPVRVFGTFVDGLGKNEWREFKGKQITIVEAATKGRVELLIVPQGLTKAADVVRVMLDVNGARPPPVDPVDPEPKPPEPVKSFRVFLIWESMNTLTPEQKAVLDGKAVEDFLNATCTGGKKGWGKRDKDADGSADEPVLAAMWAAVKPKITSTPCVAVGVNDKVEIIPLETTPAKMIEVLKKYAGGK